MANNILHRSDISAHGTAVYAPLLRTVSPDTQEFEVEDSDGITVIVDVTATAGSGAVTVKVEGVDRVSGKTFTLRDATTAAATTAAIGAASTVVIQVAPSVTSQNSASMVSVNAVVPNVIRITATQTGTSVTYSTGLLLS